MSKIRIGIVGYGNIGRGVELAVERNADMELVAVVTRRNPETVKVLTEGVIPSASNSLQASSTSSKIAPVEKSAIFFPSFILIALPISKLSMLS